MNWKKQFDLLKETRFFMVSYLLFVLVLCLLIFSQSKMELHLLLTSNRSGFADFFFTYWTQFGGDVPYVLIGLLFFYKFSTAFFFTITQLLGAVFSFALKRMFLSPRPSAYFQQNFPEIALPHVENMPLYTSQSMPSGHTITAFAFFFCISLVSRNKWVQFICFVMAASVGYSRIYLSQHFTQDVFVGSIIGVFCAWICYPFYTKWNEKFLTRSLRDNFSKIISKNIENQK